MSQVTVLPLGLELEVSEDQTVMSAAHAAGPLGGPPSARPPRSSGLVVNIVARAPPSRP